MTIAPIFFNEHFWDDRLESEVRSIRAGAGDSVVPMLPASGLIIPRQMRIAHYRVSHHVMHGAFQAAATGFAMNILPVIYANSDGEGAAALDRLCRAVVMGAGLGAGIGGLRAVIAKVMESLRPVMLDKCKGGGMLQSVVKLVSQGGLAVATGITSAAICVAESISHLFTAMSRLVQGDRAAALLSLHQALGAVTPSAIIDSSAFFLANEAANTLIAALLPTLPLALTTGPLAAIVTVGLYGLAQGFVWYLHAQIDIRGKWIPWAKALLRWEKRERVWASVNQTIATGTGPAVLQQSQPLPNLTPIAVRLPIPCIDPVRNKRSGQLYEKAYLMRALELNGRDPTTNLAASSKEYVYAPVAKRCAEEVAMILNLVQENV